jgi:hypothetical protein
MPKKVFTGFHQDKALAEKLAAQAKAEGRSVAFILRRAVERELSERFLTPNRRQTSVEDDVVYTAEVAKMLGLSPRTVLRRAKRGNDPLNGAKSRLGCKKPQAFSLAKIRALQRGLV